MHLRKRLVNDKLIINIIKTDHVIKTFGNPFKSKSF